MIGFKIAGVRIRIYFGFFAVLMIYLYIGERLGTDVETALCCCLLHELGHLAAMLACGVRPAVISFYCGGISISARGMELLGKAASAFILLAGCTVNLMLSVVSFITGHTELHQINLALALFNLLPYPYFDGGRLITLFFSERTARFVSSAILIFAAVLVVFNAGISLPVLAVFIAASVGGRSRCRRQAQ